MECATLLVGRGRVVTVAATDRDHEYNRDHARLAAFDELYAQFRQPLYNYIYRLLGDRESADDLLQDTFVKVYRALDSLPDASGRSAWLYRIATNTCYDVLRRRRLVSWLPWTRHGADGEEIAFDPPGDDGDLGGRYAVNEAVQDALRRVPATLRAPLLLHVVHGFGYADIARMLGLTESAVKMRVSRARTAFRAVYDSGDAATDCAPAPVVAGAADTGGLEVRG